MAAFDEAVAKIVTRPGLPEGMRPEEVIRLEGSQHTGIALWTRAGAHWRRDKFGKGWERVWGPTTEEKTDG